MDSRGRLSLREICMTRLLFLTFFVLSAFVLASAQESASTAHASSIAGTVVKEPGSQPLKKVLVQVVAENQKEGGNYTASTDADGHFHIENVVPGRYRIFIERTGFVGVNEHGLKSEVNVFTVQAGQAVEDAENAREAPGTMLARRLGVVVVLPIETELLNTLRGAPDW